MKRVITKLGILILTILMTTTISGCGKQIETQNTTSNKTYENVNSSKGNESLNKEQSEETVNENTTKNNKTNSSATPVQKQEVNKTLEKVDNNLKDLDSTLNGLDNISESNLD